MGKSNMEIIGLISDFYHRSIWDSQSVGPFVTIRYLHECTLVAIQLLEVLNSFIYFFKSRILLRHSWAVVTALICDDALKKDTYLINAWYGSHFF